ncbi:DUF4917 family protein [Rhodohalobacter sp. 8-1]|uniref:DUF4917 family protein n=1 Tax=Rhodohalobacter sp. 8-1 TaxID=3131972 RepID=UPI0030ED61E1
MPKLISFQQAIKKTKGQKRHLILGNGFSIACRPDIFRYDTLYNQADFSKCMHAEEVFKRLKTHDFEIVIDALEKGAKVAPIYGGEKELIELLETDAMSLKHLLVDTVANNHPARPNDISDAEYRNCRNFLNKFLNEDECDRCSVYTLNYDLLLYWALMHEEENDKLSLRFNDGFNHEFLGYEEDGEGAIFSPDLTWQGETQSHSQNIHYLHGALHLYDEGSQLTKYTWINTGVALTDQARYSIENGFFPLFVSEGNSDKKLDKVLHSAYLHKAYRSYVSNTNVKSANFFTYGYSFSDNDEHISKKIGEGKCKRIFVGVFGDIDSKENQLIIEKLEALKGYRSNRYPLEVEFYEVESAKVWG